MEIESFISERKSFSERAVLIRLEYGIQLSVFEVLIGFYFIYIYNIKIYIWVGLEIGF